VRPPLRGKRDAARRLVDGLRRTVANVPRRSKSNVIAPEEAAPEETAPEEAAPEEAAPDCSARPVSRPDDDAGARIDAARERLRAAVPPPEEDGEA